LDIISEEQSPIFLVAANPTVDGKMIAFARCFTILMLLIIAIGSCRCNSPEDLRKNKGKIHKDTLGRIEKETALAFPDNSRVIHFLEPDVIG
jgi:hypothetical protein